MITKNPSYITKNRLGIYVFQYKIPSHFRKNNHKLKVLFRKSLRTRCHKEALKKSRKLIVYIDDLQKKYFKDSQAYEMGMELLKTDEYMVRQWPDFDDYEENFLSGLDESESTLLRKAYALNEERNIQSEVDSVEIERLKKTIDVLNQSSGGMNDKEDIYLSCMVELWLVEKNRELKKSSMEECKEATAMFTRIISEERNNEKILVSDINSTLINTYISTLYDLPTNINKRKETINKNIQEILSLNLRVRSPTTVKLQTSNIAEMFDWGESRNYSVLSGVVTALRTVKKSKPRDKKIRVPFDEIDLGKLFNSDEYRLGKVNSPSKYWVPLMALFSGGTLGELVQLYISDIYEKDGVWVFDINSENEKELKVEGDSGRVRLVPIHPQLKKLGFLDFVDHQKSSGHIKLFPNEKRNIKNQFGGFSKAFLRYRNKVGAGPRNDKEYRDFHSFRHLVRSDLEEKGVESGLIDDILGHTSGDRSIGKKVYSHSQLVKLKYDAIKKLKYPFINFAEIRDWKHHKFKI